MSHDIIPVRNGYQVTEEIEVNSVKDGIKEMIDRLDEKKDATLLTFINSVLDQYLDDPGSPEDALSTSQASS